MDHKKYEIWTTHTLDNALEINIYFKRWGREITDRRNCKTDMQKDGSITNAMTSSTEDNKRQDHRGGKTDTNHWDPAFLKKGPLELLFCKWNSKILQHIFLTQNF